MVSSLLFGESCTVFETEGEWMHVTCGHDGYTGWVPENYLKQIPDDKPDWTRRLDLHGALWQNVEARIDLSPGSLLPDTDETHISGHHYRFVDSRAFHPETRDAAGLATLFLHTPYLWGGRTVWGIDCSGLTQVVFSVLGHQLPRDASQQATAGSPLSFGEQQSGDLALFEKDGKITHVGILTAPDRIIHASGRVRIDAFSGKGITNSETGELTHSLHSLRRIR